MIIFFSEKEYMDHHASRLNEHIKEFFIEIQSLPKDSLFDLKYIPNEKFRDQVKNSQSRSTDASKSIFLFIKKFFDKFVQLDQVERDGLVRNFLIATGELKEIISNANQNDLEIKYKNYPKIQKELKELFNFLYEKTLTSFNIKNHYNIISEKLLDEYIPVICPICGTGELSDPDIIKADYDHLLCQELYPFTSIFLGNLIPCCIQCNRGTKKNTDILRNQYSQRRKFKYPFSEEFKINSTLKIDVTLNSSVVRWKVDINPYNEYTQTWDEIYKIKDRYEKIITKNFFRFWLKELKDECIEEKVNKRKNFINKINVKINTYKKNPLSSFGLLRAPAFEAFKQNSDLVDIAFQQIVSS